MSYFLEIKIYGSSTEVEAILDVMEAASEETVLGLRDGIDSAILLQKMEDAVTKGEALSLFRKGYNDVFDNVTGLCKEAGLSFVVFMGERGEEGCSHGWGWKPGMAEDHHFLVNDEEPVLTLSSLDRVSKQGPDAINELIRLTKESFYVGGLDLDESVIEELRSRLHPQRKP